MGERCFTHAGQIFINKWPWANKQARLKRTWSVFAQHDGIDALNNLGMDIPR